MSSVIDRHPERQGIDVIVNISVNLLSGGNGQEVTGASRFSDEMIGREGLPQLQLPGGTGLLPLLESFIE